MQKLLYFNNRANPRFVFQTNIEKPSAQAAGGLAQSFKEQNELYNRNLNVRAELNADPKKTFEDLAKKASEKNPAITPDSIAKNFRDALKDGTKVEDVWKYLEDNGCNMAAIIEGLLRFFKTEEGKGVKEIAISDFLKPLEMKIGAEGTVTHAYLEQRKNLMMQTAGALAAFKKGFPELPKKPASPLGPGTDAQLA